MIIFLLNILTLQYKPRLQGGTFYDCVVIKFRKSDYLLINYNLLPPLKEANDAWLQLLIKYGLNLS